MPRLLRDVVIYGFGNSVPALLGIVLLPVYSRYLLPAEYGILSATQTLSSILGVLLLLSIDRSVFRLYHDHKTERARRKFLGTVTLSVVGISSSATLLLFLFGSEVERIFENVPFHPYIEYTLLGSYFSVFSRIPKVVLQTERRSTEFLGLSMLQIVVSTGLSLWYLMVEMEGVVGIIKGMMYGNLVLIPVFAFYTFRSVDLQFERETFLGVLKYSIPIIPSLVSAWVLNLSDRIFIERIVGLDEVGLYSMGYKIAGLVLFFAQAFGMAYNPIFYKLASSEDQLAAKKKLEEYNFLYALALMFVSGAIALFAKDVLDLLFDPKYLDAGKYVALLSLAYFITYMGGLSNLALYQEKMTDRIMYSTVAAATVNIGLNFLLIPRLGAMGAAVSTVIAYSLNTVTLYVFSKKAYFIQMRWKTIWAVGSALVLLVVLSNEFLSLQRSSGMIVKFAVLAALFVVVVGKSRFDILKILRFG